MRDATVLSKHGSPKAQQRALRHHRQKRHRLRPAYHSDPIISNHCKLPCRIKLQRSMDLFYVVSLDMYNLDLFFFCLQCDENPAMPAPIAASTSSATCCSSSAQLQGTKRSAKALGSEALGSSWRQIVLRITLPNCIEFSFLVPMHVPPFKLFKAVLMYSTVL